MSELPKLHDSTLVSIQLDWEAGIMSLTMQIGPAAADVGILTMEGVTNFICPRLMPWGPSDSINSVSAEDIAGDKLIVVEMQSGDVIKIQCMNVAYTA
jgi:hypothetical protein